MSFMKKNRKVEVRFLTRIHYLLLSTICLKNDFHIRIPIQNGTLNLKYFLIKLSSET